MSKKKPPEKKMFESDITGAPALNLVWKGIAGGAIGAILGTWVYPDLGTLVGSILGIIGGVLFGEIVDAKEPDYEHDPEFQLETSKKARAFFNSIRKEIKLKRHPTLQNVEKKDIQRETARGEGYRLHLFDQAVTSRGTGVFPHKHKPKPKSQEDEE